MRALIHVKWPWRSSEINTSIVRSAWGGCTLGAMIERYISRLRIEIFKNLGQRDLPKRYKARSHSSETYEFPYRIHLSVRTCSYKILISQRDRNFHVDKKDLGFAFSFNPRLVQTELPHIPQKWRKRRICWEDIWLPETSAIVLISQNIAP